MTYEETNELCESLGIVLECYSPLEISYDNEELGCGFASGDSAKIVLEYYKENLHYYSTEYEEKVKDWNDTK